MSNDPNQVISMPPRRVATEKARAELTVAPPPPKVEGNAKPENSPASEPEADRPAPAPAVQAPAAPTAAAPSEPPTPPESKPRAESARKSRETSPGLPPVYTGRRRGKPEPVHGFLLKIPKTVWEQADQAAKDENISTTAWIINLMIKELRQRKS